MLFAFCGGQASKSNRYRAPRASPVEVPDVHERTKEKSLVSSREECQLAYQDNQLGAFVHYGPASYTGNYDMLCVPDVSQFNTDQLDVEQWVLAAKSFGAKSIILTAKHHNGFCLWATQTTDYSVKNCPWKSGAGDAVREFGDAARKHGIAPGLYFSLGDTQTSAWHSYSWRNSTR